MWSNCSRMPSNKRIRRLASQLTGKDQDDPFIAAVSLSQLQEIVRDYDGDELDLSTEAGSADNGLAEADIAALIEALQQNFTIHTLLLWGNREVTDTIASNIRHLLEVNATLTSINLDLTSISEHSKESIQQLLLASRIERITVEFPGDVLKVCDLSRAGLNDENAKFLAAALEKNTSLTSLSLWANSKLTDVGAALLKKSFPQNTNLVSLNLDMTGLSEFLKKDLINRVNQTRFDRCMKRCRANDIYFETMNLTAGEIGFKELNRMTETLRNNKNITRLNLTNNLAITSADISMLLSVLPSTRVIHIEADWSRFTADLVSGFRAYLLKVLQDAMLQNHRHCTRIDICNLDIDTTEFIRFLRCAQENKTLSLLNASRNEKISDEVQSDILAVINSHPTLTRINLTGTGCTRKTIAAISEGLKRKEIERISKEIKEGCPSIAIRNKDFKDFDLNQICSGFQEFTNLRTLDLRGLKGISDSGVRALQESLMKGNNTSLSRLFLDGTSCTFSKRSELCKDMTSRALRQAEAEISHIQLLDLSGLSLRNADMKKVCSMIGRGVVIKTLDLSQNPALTDEIADMLVKSIEQSSSLTRLHLGRTGLGVAVRSQLLHCMRSRSIRDAIAALMQKSHSVRLVGKESISWLANQDLGDNDASPLSSAMMHSTEVGCIDLRHNPRITDRSAKWILNCIAANPSWHTISLENTSISPKMMSDINVGLAKNAMRTATTMLFNNVRSLTSIDVLRRRNLQDQDIMSLCPALASNFTVEKLDLSDNPDLTDAVVAAIEDVVLRKDSRCCLREVCLDGTVISLKGKQRLQSVLADSLKRRTVVQVVGEERKEKLVPVIFVDKELLESSLRQIEIELSLMREKVDEYSQESSILMDKASLVRVEGHPLTKDALSGLSDLLLEIRTKFSRRGPLTMSLNERVKSCPLPEVSKVISNQMKDNPAVIGVRLKFSVRSHSSDTKRLIADLSRLLGIPTERIMPLDETKTEIQDINLFGPNKQACNDVAAQLYQLAEDPRSDLCRTHNQGHEIFCHYPWATPGRNIEFPLNLQIDNQREESEHVELESSDSGSIVSKTCQDIVELFFPGGAGPQHFVRACAEAFESFENDTQFSTLRKIEFTGMNHELFKINALKIEELSERVFRCIQSDFQWEANIVDLLAEIKALNEKEDAWLEAGGHHKTNALLEFIRTKHKGEGPEEVLKRQTCQVIEEIRRAHTMCHRQIKDAVSDLKNEGEMISSVRATRLSRLKESMSKIDLETFELRESQKNDLQIIQEKLESYMSSNRRMFQLMQEKTILDFTKRKVDEQIDDNLAIVQSNLLKADVRIAPFDSAMNRRVEGYMDQMNEGFKATALSRSEQSSKDEQTIIEDIYQGSILAKFVLLHLIASRISISIALDEGELAAIANKPSHYQNLGKSQKLIEVKELWFLGAKAANGSLANCGIEEQKRHVEEISAVQTEVKAEAEMVWDRMAALPDSVVICPGSEYELMVVYMPRHRRNSLEPANLTVIPHLRGLAGNLPSKDLPSIVSGSLLWDTSQKYITEGLTKLIENCATSRQFQSDLRQAMREARQGQEIVDKSNQRKRKAQSEASDATKAADERAEVAAEAERKLLVVTQQAQSNADLLEEACRTLQKAKEASLEEEKELQQGREGVRRIEEELTVAKLKVEHLIAQRKQTSRILEELDSRCSKLTESNLALHIELKKAEENALQHKRNAEKSSKQAQTLMDALRLHVEASSAALRDTEVKAHILEAYRYIAHSAPSSFLPESRESIQPIYIELHDLVFYYHLGLELEDKISVLQKNERQMASLKEAIRTSLVFVLSQDPALGIGNEQRLAKRLDIRSISGFPKSPAGGCEITIIISDDLLEPAHNIISFLRQQFFPAIDVYDQPIIHLGRGRSSKVVGMESTEFLARGSRGVVKEARYGPRHVVSKTRLISGAISHLAAVRCEAIRAQLTSQFGTISTLCHPNILRYVGFFVENEKSRPPAIGFIQDYCDSNLTELLAQLHGHDPVIEMDTDELVSLFSELDVNGDGKVSQAVFVKRLKENPSIAKKLGISHQALTADGEIKFVWNYGDESGGQNADHLHKFAFIDHNKQKSIDLKKLFAFFGKLDFKGGRIPWAMRLELLLAITKGMQYLCSRGIVHGRLKSSNVGMGQRGGSWTLGQVMIMDYGEQFVDKLCGLNICSSGEDNAAWRAPELQGKLASGVSASTEGDIWGLGIIMWELWTGRVPTITQIRRDVDELCTESKRSQQNAHDEDKAKLTPDDPPRAFLDVMVQCLSTEARARPAFSLMLRSLKASRVGWIPEHLPG